MNSSSTLVVVVNKLSSFCNLIFRKMAVHHIASRYDIRDVAVGIGNIIDRHTNTCVTFVVQDDADVLSTTLQ